uniref:DUF4283 domain-containing protein n=1 Tax=Brassica oleracea TaxID=3712 RepID=A0A3P6AXR8_BRAOL|nr:unnamed protein product [Brassica oleracea]
MQFHWATPGHASAAKPQSPTSGDALLSPPFPPDPPDPPSHLLPLTTDVSQTQKQSVAVADTTMVQSSPENCPTITIPSLNQTEIGSHSTVPATGNPNQTSSSNPTISLSVNSTDRYKLLSPSTKSPLLTNKALNLPPPINHLPPSVQVNAATPTVQSTPHSSSYTSPPVAVLQTTSTLADQLRIKGDKSLKRLAPLKLAENGRPRVLIPDSVFHKGAELHKDFIICYFNGRPPPFGQIQSVLSHMWGKGRKLEIHNNPLQRSAIVRIPSDYLRQKILEKNIWYVGDSMFHTAQWSSAHSAATPPLSSIQIWAHLTGVPLHLRYQHSLSLVAGLVGDPKETDDFTLNLVSLTLSHVKVEVDLTRPLPRVVEFERQSGEVVEVQVDYPWLPPTCSHCKELGYVVRNCLMYTPPKNPPAETESAQNKKDKVHVSASHTQIPSSSLETPFIFLMSVKLFFWNIRDLNDPNKHRPFMDWLNSHRPIFGSILETYIKELSLASLMNSVCRGWHYTSNHLSDEDGHIVLIWKDPTKVCVLSQSRQTITCELQLPNCSPIIYTAIYASNLSEERNNLWVELLNLHTTYDLASTP